MSTGRRVLFGLALFFLALFIYRSFLRVAIEAALGVPNLPNLPGGLIVTTISLVLFSITHAIGALGLRRTLVFFALSASVAFIFEEVGVTTGLIYGPYHYTEELGFRVGHVPLLIPLAWFMMIYPSYVLANFIVSKRPLSEDEGAGADGADGPGKILWLSLVSAVVMTAWDTVIDPILSGPTYHEWVWKVPGPYFGVPVQNYVGWLLTTFTIYVVYRFLEKRIGAGRGWRPGDGETSADHGQRGQAFFAFLPLVAYGTMMVSNIYYAEPLALQVIAPFTMGFPLLLAVGGYVSYVRELKGSSFKSP